MVICAGGPRLLRQAWVAVRLLRRAGCELPIELWSARALDNPPPPRWAEAFYEQRVSLRVVEEELPEGAWRPLLRPASVAEGKPFVLKALALLATAFEEALLLDADNLALRVRRPLPSVAGAASCQACCGSGSVL